MRRHSVSSKFRLALCRASSTDAFPSPNVGLILERPTSLDDVVLLEMNNGPCNVLSPDFLAAFLKKLHRLCDPERSQCRGIILTSKRPGIFTTGLDLDVLHTNIAQDTFAHYWGQLQQLFTTLHALPIPLVCAINGHAWGAGCTVALAADFRVMTRRCEAVAESITIGLPDARHGIVVPPYVAGSLEHVVRFRKAEEMLTLGTLLPTDEAWRVGLVDQVVADHEAAEPACLEFMQKLLQLPSPAPYWKIKDVSRSRFLAPLCTPALRTQDTVSFYNLFSNHHVKRRLASHVEGHRNK